MLILKQNAANTVPSPPAGKGTIFLNTNDDLSVKSADGNVTVFPTAGGANTQVYFNDDGSFGAVANLTFNKTTSVFTVTGNVAATNVLTDNLLYANGTAWDLSDPGGSNTQIQFNDEESFGGSAAFTFNKSSNLVSMGGALAVTGNVTAGNVYANSGTIGAQTLKGEGGNISNIQGANVSGAVASATSAGSATTAGTVTTAAQPNITSVGTLSSVAVTGNVTAGNVYANSGTVGATNLTGTLTTAAQPNITSVGTLTSLGVTGNITTTTGVFIGNGLGLTNLAGANVTGTVATATTAGTVTTAAQPNITSVGTLSSLTVSGNASAGNLNTVGKVVASTLESNVATGTAPFAVASTTRVANLNVDYANVSDFSNLQDNVTSTARQLVFSAGSGNQKLLTTDNFTINPANAYFSATSLGGTLTTAAQPNITSVGTLSNLSVTANVTAGNVYANSGTVGANLLAGTLTTASQPNITSVGILSSLGVSGTANVGNLGTIGTVFANGSITTEFQFVSNASSPNAPMVVSSNVKVANLNADLLDGYDTATGATANTVVVRDANGSFSANIVTATLYGDANTAGTVTTAAQPNITSVGTLSSLSVTGNAAAGNLTTVGILSVTGTSNSSIAGNLDMSGKTVGNLATPNNASDAATKQYVDDVAQGLHTHDSCGAATPDTLANITGGTITYNNGASGVGANLVTTGSFNLIDGVNVQTAGTRILVKNEANSAHNGIYTWSNATVITRATDFDTPTEMAGGDFTFVTAGTLYDNTGWVMTDAVTTVGTSPVPWVQFSGAGTYTAGTGLTLNGSQFNISNTTVTAASYGNGDRVASFTVNAQGQLTAASNVVIAANAANLTGTTLASSIVTSSLTSVGTLGSLSVTGKVTAGQLQGDGGNISNIQGANVSGTVSSATTAGTVTTAAQPNITSVGTLSSLSVTGNVTAGNLVAPLANGNSNVNIPSANGNINLSAGGTANVLVVTSTGVNMGSGSGGNITGANLVSANFFTGTLTTAAQPNITSVGTLTGLGVNGTITGVNITANTGVFTGNGSGLSAIAGANVTGTVSSATTAGTVTTAAQPNITSVGTLSSLSVTANVTAGNVYANSGTVGATNLTGTLTTAAQPNITSVGTLTSVAITGNATAGNVYANSGTVGATNLTGTLTTAAQPNITSVGTLTSLTSSGNISGANVISSAYSIVSVNAAVSANSTAQSTGRVLASQFNVVSSANYLNNAVVLPAAVAGMRITVINTTASDILVYPAVNGRINSIAANVAYTHVIGARLDYIATSTTQWYTLNATYG